MSPTPKAPPDDSQIEPFAILLVPDEVGPAAPRRLPRGRLPVAMVLLAASAFVMSLVFFPQERFRIPTIDPATIVLAAGLALRRTDPRPTS